MHEGNYYIETPKNSVHLLCRVLLKILLYFSGGRSVKQNVKNVKNVKNEIIHLFM